MNKTQPRFITTRLELDIATGRTLLQEGYWYEGPIEECKGSDVAEQGQQQSQAAFSKQLMDDYSTRFADQSGIVQSLKSSLQPILNAGAGQYGYSKAEDAALRTQASAGTSASYRSAKQAVGESQAAVGGGNTFLPSGVKAQQNSQIATAAAQQEADQQLGITSSGYDVGRQQFNNAVNQTNQLAGIINPTAYASDANNASNLAFSQANEINKQNNAASPWNVVGGLLGGIGGAFGTAIGSYVTGSGATKKGGTSFDSSGMGADVG